jgi:hypothetical protein
MRSDPAMTFIDIEPCVYANALGGCEWKREDELADGFRALAGQDSVAVTGEAVGGIVCRRSWAEVTACRPDAARLWQPSRR